MRHQYFLTEVHRLIKRLKHSDSNDPYVALPIFDRCRSASTNIGPGEQQSDNTLRQFYPLVITHRMSVEQWKNPSVKLSLPV